VRDFRWDRWQGLMAGLFTASALQQSGLGNWWAVLMMSALAGWFLVAGVVERGSR